MLSFLRRKKENVLNQIKKENLKNIRKNYLNDKVINDSSYGITNKKYFKEDIIISLTTYNTRIKRVYLVIESLFQQTTKANKVILWLDEKEYTLESIPESLKLQMKRGLEIKFYKNIKSYKKLIPTLKLYSDQIIITTDDDIIYPSDFVENFIFEYKKNSKYIYCYCGRKIKFKDKKLEKYTNWGPYSNDLEASLDKMPIGFGGVLYPPNCFYKDILNEELFMKFCPSGDDIWFKAMSLKNNYKCKIIEYREEVRSNFLDINSIRDQTLTSINVDGGKNDKQLKVVFDYYDLYKKIIK